jgi:hypothetical protein
MATYYDDDETEENFDTPLVKKLRSQLKEQSKALAERDTQLAEMAGKERKRVIADVLVARELNPKIAAFIPTDIAPEPEAVLAWVSEYGDVFGVQTQQPPVEQEQQSAAQQAQADSFNRMAAVDRGGQPPVGTGIMSQIENAQNEEELFAALRGAI